MATSQDSCHISTPVPIQLACHWSGLNNNNKKYTLCFHLEAFFFFFFLSKSTKPELQKLFTLVSQVYILRK